MKKATDYLASGDKAAIAFRHTSAQKTRAIWAYQSAVALTSIRADASLPRRLAS
jgi:hypothetical protein